MEYETKYRDLPCGVSVIRIKTLQVSVSHRLLQPGRGALDHGSCFLKKNTVAIRSARVHAGLIIINIVLGFIVNVDNCTDGNQLFSDLAGPP